MNKIQLFLIAIVLFTVSCNKKEEIQQTDNTTAKLQQVSTDIKEIQEIIYTEKSVYAKYFDNNVDYNVSLFSNREYPLVTRDFSVSNYAVKDGSIPQTNILINEKIVDSIRSLNYENKFIDALKYNPVTSTFINEFYGKEVNFQIADIKFPLYIPEIVEITFPMPKGNYYSADYAFDFRLEWNADSKNLNGVAIIVEWDGSMFFDEDKKVYVRRIDIVKDNGETIIKKEMFENIPDFAVVKVSILRGNIDIMEVADEVYKIYAVSEASLRSIISHKTIE